MSGLGKHSYFNRSFNTIRAVLVSNSTGTVTLTQSSAGSWLRKN